MLQDEAYSIYSDPAIRSIRGLYSCSESGGDSHTADVTGYGIRIVYSLEQCNGYAGSFTSKATPPRRVIGYVWNFGGLPRHILNAIERWKGVEAYAEADRSALIVQTSRLI